MNNLYSYNLMKRIEPKMWNNFDILE